jgi:hypothetical protein
MRRLGVLVLALGLTACGSGGKTQERWSGKADVSGFNAFVERARPDLARSPATLAAEFVRLDRVSAGTTSLVARAAPEGGGPATVVVTLDRLADDSVRAVRYILRFERRDEGSWHLRSAFRSQRCWPGRGHQGFSAAPCI